MRVAVVVAGDLARSPRMLNHAREFAAHGISTTLIGYCELAFEPPPGVAVRALRPWRGISRLGLPGAALRMSLVLLQLVIVLFSDRPSTILVQNPPAFPTLLAAWIAARLTRARLIVDWHNYGYSMLALRLGAEHFIVGCAKRYEFAMARRADFHLCVSAAMRRDLPVEATVLYDRPLRFLESEASPDCFIVVCPAGWTADEDMSLLLDALELLKVRNLEIHLTGDGPLRTTLEPRIAGLRAAGLAVHTGFLSESAYWSLIRSASLGISMHCSSSGLDLAMKVVDLFSAGVPVCALSYGGALPEQISDGSTGFLFRTAAQLAGILERVPDNFEQLAAMRSTIRRTWNRTWADEWSEIVMIRTKKA